VVFLIGQMATTLWYDYYYWLHHPMTNLYDEYTWNYALLYAKEICKIEDMVVAERLWYERSMYSPIMAKIMGIIRSSRDETTDIERFYSWVKTIDLEDDYCWMMAVYYAQHLGIVIETIPEPIEDLLRKNTVLIFEGGQYYIEVLKGFRAFIGGSVKKFLKNEIYSVFTNLENGLMYPDKKVSS